MATKIVTILTLTSTNPALLTGTYYKYSWTTIWYLMTPQSDAVCYRSILYATVLLKLELAVNQVVLISVEGMVGCNYLCLQNVIYGIIIEFLGN